MDAGIRMRRAGWETEGDAIGIGGSWDRAAGSDPSLPDESDEE
jgi:hypothetical protein